MKFNQIIYPSLDEIAMLRNTFHEKTGHYPVIVYYNPKLISLSVILDEIHEMSKYHSTGPYEELKIMNMIFHPNIKMSDQLEFQ